MKPVLRVLVALRGASIARRARRRALKLRACWQPLSSVECRLPLHCSTNCPQTPPNRPLHAQFHPPSVKHELTMSNARRRRPSPVGQKRHLDRSDRLLRVRKMGYGPVAHSCRDTSGGVSTQPGMMNVGLHWTWHVSGYGRETMYPSSMAFLIASCDLPQVCAQSGLSVRTDRNTPCRNFIGGVKH